jgi:hypothetical protein
MAKMYPDFFDRDVKSSAERRLYEALARDLGDEWVVFHHVKWIGIDDLGRRCDGEADFVVAHAQLGVLVIEVKGGRIHFDESTGHYISTDREGIEHDIQDPFEQAMKSKKNFIEKVRGLPGWPRGRVLFGHAVAFPDMIAQTTQLRLNAPRDVVIDAVDLAALEQKLRNIYLFWNTSSRPSLQAYIPLGQSGMNVLVSTLYQSGLIRNPLLAESVRNDEQALVRLTNNQLGYLRFLRNHRRAAIGGCAGSGKTFLAVEKARQLAENEQQKVLFLCYNQGLAYHIREELGYQRLFDVFDFHQLCTHLAREAGQTLPSQNTDSQEYFDTVLPSFLWKAVDVLGPRYDAVIVDEGQDFRSEWWEVLPWLLQDPDNGYFYIFFDDNQRMYRDRSPVPLTLAHEPYHLDENCRNTQRIANVVRKFYAGEQSLKVLGPEGLPIEIVLYSTPHNGKDQLRRVLHRLIVEGGFSHDQITVLSARGTRVSDVLGQRLGNIQLTDRLPLANGEVFATTIRRFKGLENTVIVLCEVDGRLPVEDIEVLMYVGTSRAKLYLLVLLAEDAPEKVTEIFKPYFPR